MSSVIERTKGCTNVLVGLANELTGSLIDSQALRDKGKCLRQRGRAQINWAREMRNEERTRASVKDVMIRKLTTGE